MLAPIFSYSHTMLDLLPTGASLALLFACFNDVGDPADWLRWLLVLAVWNALAWPWARAWFVRYGLGRLV